MRDDPLHGSRSAFSLGVALYPTQAPQELRRLAHLAEELGYRNLWFGDSQNIWREVYVTMGAAAVGTQRIIIGSGVTNAVTRHTSVLASAWVTLSELADGRVVAGFGTGFTSVRTMGLKPMRLADLERTIGDLRTLWSGEAAVHQESGEPYRLSYLDGKADIPIYVAASGPRLLHLAGRMADGVIVLVGTDPETVRTALDTVAAGARESGRDFEDLHIVLWSAAAIDEDGGKARDRVRPHVASTVMQALRMELPPQEAKDVARIREAYDYYHHMVPGSPHAQLVSDDLVNRFALAGTPRECRERIVALAAIGVDQIAIIPFPAPDQDRAETLHGFAPLAQADPG